MNTIKISATKARNDFFNLLNIVASGSQVIVEKDFHEIALISPRKKSTNWVELKKLSHQTHGISKDFDFTDNPLRSPNASDFLGKWDKNL